MATARFILDTRRANSAGLFPVKIRVAHVREFTRIDTTVALTEADFEKIVKGTNLKEPLKTIKVKLDKLVDKANSIIESLDPFDFDTFKVRFSQKGNRSDIIFLLQSKADEFAAAEKFSSESLYKQTAAFLLEFVNRNKGANATRNTIIPIKDITVKWLTDLERWAVGVKQDSKLKPGTSFEKYSLTTINMYIVRVRTIFNDVISKRELAPSAYPFYRPDNKLGYKIPKGANNKRPLGIDSIMELYDYQPANPGEDFAKDIFMFSYLASGMNMSDIFRLRWSDVHSDHFSFVRKKTAAKTGGAVVINIPLNDDLRAIMEKHGSRKIGNSYIFDVLPASGTEIERHKKTRSVINHVNTSLKKITKKLGWPDDSISTYFARHSYSTNLMEAEAPLAFISKQLGHMSIKTTQDYLGSFSTNKAAKYQDALLKKNKTA